jgi:hypothetical protein
MSGDATLSNTGALTLATVPISKGGTGLTSFASDKLVTTSGAGAVQTTSCGLNQVISFTAGGAITCTNISALASGFINGGNAFAGAASLGTTDAYDLSVKTNNVTRLTASAGGNIGIGTATPGGLLTVENAANGSTEVQISTPGTGASQDALLSFVTLSNSSSLGQAGNKGWLFAARGDAYTTASAQNDLLLSFWNGTASTQTMAFDSQTGNVGIGTTAPKVSLDVAGAIRPGSSTSVTTCGSGAANGEGSQRYNYTTHYMEYCNGTTWVPYAQAQASSSIVAPAGSGYFVITAATFAGNASASLGGWDTACLNELKTNNPNWRGYATANANGQLTASKIHAFLCYDTTGCNNLTPLATYYFANAGDSSAGGASFTTDANGLGPNDNAIWSAANYFNIATLYYTGRASGTSTVWSASSNWGMNNATSSAYGSSGNTDSNRWRAGTTPGSAVRIICMVNP